MKPQKCCLDVICAHVELRIMGMSLQMKAQ